MAAHLFPLPAAEEDELDLHDDVEIAREDLVRSLEASGLEVVVSDYHIWSDQFDPSQRVDAIRGGDVSIVSQGFESRSRSRL